MAKEFSDTRVESALRNPKPFQDELWADERTSQLYGTQVAKVETNDSWEKYVGAASKLELYEGPKPIEFTNELYHAYQKAVDEKKPLIVAFTQDNCPYCDKLNKETFRSNDLKEYASKGIWVKVNPAKDEDDKGNVAGLAKELGIDRYPTTVIIEAKADSMKELGRMVGYFPPKEFAENLKQIMPKPINNNNNVVMLAMNPSDNQNAA